MVRFTSNIKEINKNLMDLVKVVASTNIQALTEVGERGVGILRRNTPVKDGRLRNSMSYTLNGKVFDPLNAKNDGDKLRVSNKKDRVIIGTNVVYGPRVEYLAKNGSAGYMLRSYKQLKPIAMKVMKTVFRRRGF